MDKINLIITLEKELLLDETRQNLFKLELLISDNFKEIGSYGSIYNKQDVLDNLPKTSIGSIETSDWSCDLLSEGMFLLNYKIEKDNLASIRTSIWAIEDESWKLRFHQSTILK